MLRNLCMATIHSACCAFNNTTADCNFRPMPWDAIASDGSFANSFYAASAFFFTDTAASLLNCYKSQTETGNSHIECHDGANRSNDNGSGVIKPAYFST